MVCRIGIMIDFKPPFFPFTIENLSKSIRTGELLPSKLTGLCLDRIEKFNHILNSFITLRSEEEIFEIAEKCDKQAKQNDLLNPLHGIPYSIKDMIHAKHIKFTAGSNFILITFLILQRQL